MSRFAVELTTSRSTALAVEAGPLTFRMGPWKTRRYALKQRAACRKERAVYDWGDGFVDCGPAFFKVVLIEKEVKPE